MAGSGKHYRTGENNATKKKGILRRLIRLVFSLILIVIIAFGALIGFLSVTEYKPADREPSTVLAKGSKALSVGDEISIMSWNIGYAALGDNADFFMDGGSSVYTADKERVSYNLAGIINQIKDIDPEILLVQEVDRDSARSYHIDEFQTLQSEFPESCSSFANNFKVAFIPYPIPPIGKVDSGIASFSKYSVEAADRIQLPIPFSWPIRMSNLKRCLLVSHIPIEGSDKELVVFNLHLEAYDDGTGKAAQTKMLAELLKAETDKGNYVIAGGDFNQIFSSVDRAKYPINEELWQPGEIDISAIEGNWQFLMDEAVPSCRSLDRAYSGADHDSFQYYLIDGFIVSGNIEIKSFETKDLGFICSDHNPVVAKIILKE
ncbi:MAG: endonuclease [Mogibacterium sp.]|nr:endonuclease [Mogibacterium sp.]